MKRALGMICLAAAVAACDSKGASPTAPTTPTAPAQTRELALEGDLAFGDVRVGSTATKLIRVVNRGSGPLTVTGIAWPASGSVFTANWTNGTIASNQWQDIAVNFTPPTTQSYSGTVTVQANHTSGTNTMAVSGRGVRDPFRRAGVGDTVFDLPPGVTRLRITGTYTANSSNFIVYVGGRLIVNELLGRGWGMTHFEGTYVVSGTVVEIRSSSGVAWTFTEQ